MTQRLIPREDAPPAPRVFRRRTSTPPAMPTSSCWSSNRLSNAPTMIATMLDACDDAAILSQIYKVVDSDRRRRAAA